MTINSEDMAQILKAVSEMFNLPLQSKPLTNQRQYYSANMISELIEAGATIQPLS